MSLAEFWRSTPRLTNICVHAYLRRRAWAAFHAGYGLHAKDAAIEKLMGREPKPRAMSPEQMRANMRRIMVGVNAMRKAKGLDDGE